MLGVSTDCNGFTPRSLRFAGTDECVRPYAGWDGANLASRLRPANSRSVPFGKLRARMTIFLFVQDDDQTEVVAPIAPG
jgi:hypothetical protein